MPCAPNTATTFRPSVTGVESTWVALVWRANFGTVRTAVRIQIGRPSARWRHHSWNACSIMSSAESPAPYRPSFSEDSPPLDELLAGGLRDTFRDAHADAEAVGTYHGFRGEAGRGKIDYVLVDEGWSTVSAAIVRDHEGGRYPSDHYPVVAVVGQRARVAER